MLKKIHHTVSIGSADMVALMVVGLVRRVVKGLRNISISPFRQVLNKMVGRQGVRMCNSVLHDTASTMGVVGWVSECASLSP